MRPANETDLSEAISTAQSPVVIQGGGTRTLGPCAGDSLDTSAMSGVEMYEPGALTLVVRAGTALAEIDAVLAAERQRLAFDPPDLRAVLGRDGTSTIGGVVAANASGPRRVQVGACRDALLGVRFVDGAGNIVKNGGRVMKNVTGYDLVKLMAGSHGTLGVITEVSFKVQAMPEAELTLIAPRELGPGLAALQAALGSPFDISGAGYMAGQAMIRIEGMAGSVAYRADALTAILGGDWARVSATHSAAIWRDLRDVIPFAGRDGAVWRVSVKASDAARVTLELGLTHEAIYDWGGGLIWILMPEGGAPAVRRAVGAAGHATLVRGIPGMEDVPVFPPESAGVAALTAALRAKFDPHGVLNQGLMGQGPTNRGPTG